LANSKYYDQNGGQLSPNPPKYLDKIAAAMWRKIVPYLLEKGKDVRRIDSGLVEMYCTQYEVYRKAYKSIKEDGTQQRQEKSIQNNRGEVIGKDFIGYRRNPATSIYNDALKQLTAVGAQLGLSPKSRAELTQMVGEGSGDKPVDVQKALKQMLGGGSGD
jgi:P27 family predicted phage terminase small subunit